MSRLEFKFKRIIKLWLEVWGYSLAFLLIWLCFFASQPSMKSVIKNLFPLSMNRYWFFSQYTILFFAMPVLNVAIKNLERKILLMILGCGFLCFSIHPFVFKTDVFHLNRGYSALWFVYLYLLAGTMAVRGLFRHIKKPVAILMAMVGLLGGIAALHIRGLFLFGIERGFDASLFRAYNCPFIVLYSVALLLTFSKVGIRSNFLRTVIITIMPSVFAVYVIHSNPLFRVMTNWNWLWRRFLNTHSLVVCIVGTVLSASLIFAGCILIDVSRRVVASRGLMKLKAGDR